MNRRFSITRLIAVFSIVFSFSAVGYGDGRKCTCNPNKGPALPVFNCIEDVLNWSRPRTISDHPTIARIPMAERPTTNGPTNLVGFDNGDWTLDPWFSKWSQGAWGRSEDGNRTAANVYNFSFWQYVDIAYCLGANPLFIPPTVWINAAHKNGVYMLGSIFPPKEWSGDVDLFAQKAIEIAGYYGFDGYLIDDEASKGGGRGERDKKLMSNLRENGLKVMWYDAPISGGGVFANYLNPGAVPFFEAAGYFQTNYWWCNANKSATPKKSFETLKNSFPNRYLEKRNHVFSTLAFYCPRCCIDRKEYIPWKKNFFPNFQMAINGNAPGGFYTGIGVYGPGAFTTWLCLVKNDQKMWDVMHIQRNQQAFWEGTAEFSGLIAGASVCDDIHRNAPVYDPPKVVEFRPRPGKPEYMAYFLEPRTVICSVPFVSDFNTGQGTFYHIEGALAASNPWNNLSIQSVLPTWRNNQDGACAFETELSYGFAYNGGSSMLVQSTTPMPPGASGVLNLFKTKIPVTTSSLQVTLVVNNIYESFPGLGLVLYYDGSDEGVEVAGSSTPLEKGWNRFTYDIPVVHTNKTPVLTTLGLRVSNPTTEPEMYKLALGRLKVLDKNQNHPAPFIKKVRPDCRNLLSWKENWNPGSKYRVYGLKDDGRSYLLGVVYNDVYSLEGNIFNAEAEEEDFTGYIVQEVTKFGDATPVGKIGEENRKQ